MKQDLARALNHQKRMLLGAAGTTSMRLSRVETTDLTMEQAFFLSGIQTECEAISNKCKEVAEKITDFHLRYGSERTKKNITKRREIQAKMNAGKWEEVTEAEATFLCSYGRKTK